MRGRDVMFEGLTKHLDMLKNSQYGEWRPKEQKGDGTREHPYQMPYVVYNEAVHSLIDEVYTFERWHQEYELNKYHQILEENGIEWGTASMEAFDVSNADGRCVTGLLMAAVRAERFCDGALLSLFKKGTIQRWAFLKE